MEYKKRANKYKTIIIIMCIIVAIGGFVLGSMYKTTTLKDYYKDFTYKSDYMYESNYNYNVAFTVLGSDISITIFMLLLADILKTLEEMRDKTK